MLHTPGETMRAWLAVALSVLLTACGASTTPRTTAPYDPVVEASTDSVALLPVTAGEGLDDFRGPTADSLVAAMERSEPGLAVVGDDASLARIREAGLEEDFARMVVDYLMRGVLDQGTLRRLGEAIRAPYLLNVRISYAERTEAGYRALTGVSTTQEEDVGVFVQLLSPRDGGVVWADEAGAEISAEGSEKTRELERIIGAASEALADRLPRSRLSHTAGQ